METLTTTIEWHLAEKGLPEKSGSYWAVHHSGFISTFDFSTKYKKFNVCDFDDERFASAYGLSCKYWAEIPDCFLCEEFAKYREE